VDHYDDAVPWERMEPTLAARRSALANTLASSVGRVIDLFAPVIECIAKQCLASSFTALDATRMPVLDAPHPLGIRSGALWLIEGAHLYAYFVYAPTGHADYIDKLPRAHPGQRDVRGSPTNNCVDRAGGARGGWQRARTPQACRSPPPRRHSRRTAFSSMARSSTLTRSPSGLARAPTSASSTKRETARSSINCRHGGSEAPGVEPKSALGKRSVHDKTVEAAHGVHARSLMELTNNEVERDLRRWSRSETWFLRRQRSVRDAPPTLSRFSRRVARWASSRAPICAPRSRRSSPAKRPSTRCYPRLRASDGRVQARGRGGRVEPAHVDHSLAARGAPSDRRLFGLAIVAVDRFRAPPSA